MIVCLQPIIEVLATFANGLPKSKHHKSNILVPNEMNNFDKIKLTKYHNMFQTFINLYYTMTSRASMRNIFK